MILIYKINSHAGAPIGGLRQLILNKTKLFKKIKIYNIYNNLIIILIN